VEETRSWTAGEWQEFLSEIELLIHTWERERDPSYVPSDPRYGFMEKLPQCGVLRTVLSTARASANARALTHRHSIRLQLVHPSILRALFLLTDTRDSGVSGQGGKPQSAPTAAESAKVSTLPFRFGKYFHERF
jgi:hypothetical protein